MPVPVAHRHLYCLLHCLDSCTAQHMYCVLYNTSAHHCMRRAPSSPPPSWPCTRPTSASARCPQNPRTTRATGWASASLPRQVCGVVLGGGGRRQQELEIQWLLWHDEWWLGQGGLAEGKCAATWGMGAAVSAASLHAASHTAGGCRSQQPCVHVTSSPGTTQHFRTPARHASPLSLSDCLPPTVSIVHRPSSAPQAARWLPACC